MKHRSALLCFVFGGFLFLSVHGPAEAQEVPVIEYELENGMQLLMVPRPGDPNIAAGWIASARATFGLSTVSITSQMDTATLILFVCSGPIKCKRISLYEAFSEGHLA